MILQTMIIIAHSTVGNRHLQILTKLATKYIPLNDIITEI